MVIVITAVTILLQSTLIGGVSIIARLCVSYSFGFYLAVLFTYIKYYHYLTVLFSTAKPYSNKKRRFGYSVCCELVVPLFRKNYYGYELFMLANQDKVILSPKYKLRVYGSVHVSSECLIQYKNNKVKCVIELNETDFSQRVEEYLRRVYKYILIIITGGALCLKFMT